MGLNEVFALSNTISAGGIARWNTSTLSRRTVLHCSCIFYSPSIAAEDDEDGLLLKAHKNRYLRTSGIL